MEGVSLEGIDIGSFVILKMKEGPQLVSFFFFFFLSLFSLSYLSLLRKALFTPSTLKPKISSSSL